MNAVACTNIQPQFESNKSSIYKTNGNFVTINPNRYPKVNNELTRHHRRIMSGKPPTSGGSALVSRRMKQMSQARSPRHSSLVSGVYELDGYGSQLSAMALKD